ncbi:MAG TPA: cytochrome P450 [Acidimicrobiia bacterium]|jgi:cytochrome P450|nr:cytochrome P450 [Acidimicrobiia bacterium]
MYTADAPAGDEFDFDGRMFSLECANTPHEVYHEVHEKCPVMRGEGMFGLTNVYVTKYEDVLWALKHPEVFSSKDVVKVGNDVPLLPLSVDPPDHAKYRRLLDPQFSPRQMAELDDEARKLVNDVIDTFASRGECNFHEEFATPLPSTFFLALMGLPQEDLPQFLQWRDDTIRPEFYSATQEEADARRAAAGKAIENYFEQKIEEKRSNPDDRLLSTIVHGEVDGRPLTHDELLGITHLLLLGGLDTVTATLDCFIVYFARHPDRRQAVLDDPTLVPAAIEELLRHQTPVMMLPRIVAQDAEIGGVQIRAGDGATLMIGAANVDEVEFDNPDDALFDRERNRHLAFGGGPHRCLGSNLARLELRVAIEEFHRRIPDYVLLADADVQFSPGIRQADTLPLRFTPEQS